MNVKELNITKQANWKISTEGCFANAFSSNGKEIILAGKNGEVRFVDMATLTERTLQLDGNDFNFGIISADADQILAMKDGSYYVYELSTGRLLFNVPAEFDTLNNIPFYFAFAPGIDTFMVWTMQGSVLYRISNKDLFATGRSFDGVQLLKPKGVLVERGVVFEGDDITELYLSHVSAGGLMDVDSIYPFDWRISADGTTIVSILSSESETADGKKHYVEILDLTDNSRFYLDTDGDYEFISNSNAPIILKEMPEGDDVFYRIDGKRITRIKKGEEPILKYDNSQVVGNDDRWNICCAKPYYLPPGYDMEELLGKIAEDDLSDYKMDSEGNLIFKHGEDLDVFHKELKGWVSGLKTPDEKSRNYEIHAFEINGKPYVLAASRLDCSLQRGSAELFD